MATRKSKSSTRKFFAYKEEDMQKAVEAVTKNGMSKKSAAITFGVPRTTLVRKLSSQTPLRRKMGPTTELSETEEILVEKWILAMARKGFPVHKNNLLLSVKKMLEETQRDTKYVLNKTPSRSWFNGFLKRHPKIKQRYSESVSKARAAVTEESIHKWFDEIWSYLKEEKLEHILEDPSRIFNGDEAGFCLCPKSGKVLGPAEIKEDFYHRVTSEKEQLTVMASFSADGKFVPPMIIFPYKKVPKVIAESVPEQWALGRSDSGWMTSYVFYEYISNHFLEYLKVNNVQRPVLLFVDGHRSHMTKQVSQFCEENGIILISLFPNTTHIMQPADVAVFKPLKAGWTAEVRHWKFENFPQEVTRYTFGSILKTVFEKYASETTIKNGFRKSGLYPFDRNNIDYSKCIPNRKISPVNILGSKTGEKNTFECALRILEIKIGNSTLEKFERTLKKNENWSGDIEYNKLFEVWRSIKEDTKKDSLNAIQPDNSPLADNLENSEHERPIRELEKDNLLAEKSSINPTWITPENKNISFYEEKEEQGFKVPTPFKKCLVFPETSEEKLKRGPNQRRKIFPAVVSSKKYREFYENEEHKKRKSSRPKKKTIEEKVESSSSESDGMDIQYQDEDMDISDLENLQIREGQYVIIKYEDQYYPGKVMKRDEEGAEVKSMKRAGLLSYKWPDVDDILYYFNEDIIKVIKEPKLKNQRGHYSVPEMSLYE